MPAKVILAFFKTALVFLLCLAAGDLVGVIACTLLDIAPIRGWSAALPYTIWFVVGVFAGLIAAWGAGVWISGRDEWDSGPKARQLITGIFLSALIVSVGLCVLFWNLWWSRGVEGDYYVPDSQSHTVTYLVAALGGMWLVWLVSKPSAKA